MASLAALGVRLLSRCGRLLGPLERFAYGSVLGLVLGSLAVLALAWNHGLSISLVVGTGVACAAMAILISPKAGAFVAADSPVTAPPAQRSSMAVSLVFVVLAALWVVLWLNGFRADESGWWTPHVNLWGDWSLHFGDATSFAYGDNFPPQHPRIAGQPFVYHYLAALTAACWVKLGVDPRIALTMQSFILCLLTTLAVFAFARRVSGDRSAAAVALVLFLLGGGMAWVSELRREVAHGALSLTAWDAGALGGAGYQWPNIIWAFLQPQRSTLYGIPLALLVLTLLLEAVRTRQWALFGIAGAVAGLLPFSNMGALLSLVLISPVLVLLFPSRQWGLFVLVAAAIGIPQLVLMQSGGAQAVSGGGAGMLRSIRWEPGWLSPNASWPLFWFKNLGVLLPLALWGLWRWNGDPISRRFLAAMLFLFILANLFVFQPWAWDNTKILLYAYAAICMIVATLMVASWRRGSPLIRAAWVVVLIVSLASGIKLQLHVLFGGNHFTFLTTEELTLAGWARHHTPPHTRFLVGLQHNHPIPVLSGRPVVMSYAGWLWSQGNDPVPFERDVRAMYALGPASDSLFEHYGVGRVVIGPEEIRSLAPDTLAWRTRFRSVYRSPSYEVFAVDNAKEPDTGTASR